MKSVSALSAVVLLGLFLVACSAGTFAPQVPSTTPPIRGVITSLQLGDDTSGSFRVVWTDDPVVGAKGEFDAAQVTVPREADIRRRVGDGYEPATLSEFKVGDVVEVWFVGAVAESYPVQATAGTVVVIGSYTGELPVPPGL